MLLFFGMVAERAVYSLGWPGAKLILHLISQVVRRFPCARHQA
jgi:hypothetical protein